MNSFLLLKEFIQSINHENIQKIEIVNYEIITGDIEHISTGNFRRRA